MSCAFNEGGVIVSVIFRVKEQKVTHTCIAVVADVVDNSCSTGPTILHDRAARAGIIFNKPSYHRQFLWLGGQHDSPKPFEAGSTSYVVNKTDWRSARHSQTWRMTMMTVEKEEGVTMTSV